MVAKQLRQILARYWKECLGISFHCSFSWGQEFIAHAFPNKLFVEEQF